MGIDHLSTLRLGLTLEVWMTGTITGHLPALSGLFMPCAVNFVNEGGHGQSNLLVLKRGTAFMTSSDQRTVQTCMHTYTVCRHAFGREHVKGMGVPTSASSAEQQRRATL